MSLNSVATDTPAVQKMSPQPISVFNLTAQFKFTEFPMAPGTGAGYDFQLLDSTGTNFFDVFLDDLGNVFVQVGAVALTPSFVGVWTPNNGTHKVHMTSDALGTPTLFIDDVEIVLTPIGDLAPIVVGSNNNIAISAIPAVPGAVSMMVLNFFLTQSVVPTETVFCCP